MKKYRVTQSRKSEFPNPICVKKGEMVRLIETSDEAGEWAGWIYCKTMDNAGWIPKQIIEADGTSGFITENYDAREFDLEVGEILISEKELNGWIWCFKATTPAYKAWAPLNHVEIIEP